MHLPSGSDPVAARALIGPEKLLGMSIHTVTEAEAIDPAVVDYALAGPAFETVSKPGYGPEIGRKGLAEIARADAGAAARHRRHQHGAGRRSHRRGLRRRRGDGRGDARGRSGLEVGALVATLQGVYPRAR